MSAATFNFASPVDGVPPDVSRESLVLEPIRDGTDVLLIFAPGALTAADDYIPLAKEFQASSTLKLWVVILNFPGNIPTTEATDASFDGVIERVKALGFKPGQLPSDNVFLAGHSWGAWISRTVALRRAQGFVQMGSCFHTNPDNLSQYPKPVLTLNGERDAQLTLAASAKHAGEIFEVEEQMGNNNTYALKPVIVIPGMNHAQFSHGIPNTERGDLPAEIPIEAARLTIAQMVTAFLEVQVEESASAFQLLKAAVQQTHTMCKPYWEAIRTQGDFAQQFQLHIAGLPENLVRKKDIAVVVHDYKDNFIYSKPSINLKYENAAPVVIHTYLRPYGKYDIVKSLWIKMKSREAMSLSFGVDGAKDIKITAAGFNEQTFSEALNMVPEKARKKYLELGKKVVFVDDMEVTDSSIRWIESDVMINRTSNAVEVTSPVLISPTKNIAPRFAGMHYMKLLTLAGAMQIILEDSFRTKQVY